MTAAVKTECANARSTHFPTREDAEAEVLARKIRDARDARTPRARHVEPCEPCGVWMIVSPTQRANRQATPAFRRGR